MYSLKGRYDVLSTKYTSSITTRLENALEVTLKKTQGFLKMSAAKPWYNFMLSRESQIISFLTFILKHVHIDIHIYRSIMCS